MSNDFQERQLRTSNITTWLDSTNLFADDEAKGYAAELAARGCDSFARFIYLTPTTLREIGLPPLIIQPLFTRAMGEAVQFTSRPLLQGESIETWLAFHDLGH